MKRIAITVFGAERLHCPTHQDGTIELNPQLCDALFKGVLKKSEKYPTHLPSKLLDNAFLRRMLPQQRITRGGAQAQVRGSLPPISLQTKKRQGSKKVTCVIGLEVVLA